jgi:transposase
MNAVLEQHFKNEAQYWVGADVAKRTFDAGLVRPGQHYPSTPLREVPVATFARSLDGVQEFLSWLAQQLHVESSPVSVRLVMEATGWYSEELTGWLNAQCPALAPAIVNARQTAAYLDSMELRNKTDRVEARALAFYGAERRPAPYETLSPERRELRALSRSRDALIEERVREQNRGEQPFESKLLAQLHKRRLEQLTRDITRIETRMKNVIDTTPELRRDAKLLRSIPGVAFVTSAVVLAELGDLRRFSRARQVTAFAGLTPRTKQSGTSVNAPAVLCKRGNPRIRQALYMAAMSTIKVRGPLKDLYDRLIAKGRNGKAALCAVMRKMLTIMRAILIQETPYNPQWKKQQTIPSCPVENSAENA